LNEWIVTAASAGVVLFMVAVAAVLGFRARAKLDDAAVAALARTEGEESEAAVVAANARSAFARLRGGKVMVARVMGADVSARIAPASAVRVRLSGDRLSVRFADVGYPPLNMRLSEAPGWVAALAAGDAP
jgi:hypothetical protein